MRAHQFVPAGDTIAPVNKDIQPFLLYFLPKGQSLNWRTMNAIVKQFHLAFKGMETKEIYDVLMEQLVATIKGYDPNYTEKVRMVVEAIENELPKRKQFRFADVNRHLSLIVIAIAACWASLASSGSGKPPRSGRVPMRS